MNTTTLSNEVFDQKTTHTVLLAGLAVALWLGSAIYLGIQGAFSVGGPRVALAAFTLGPIALYLAAYALSPELRRLILSVDLRILVLLHGFRTVGIGFLFLYAYGILPGLFAWPAAVGDALTAFAAMGLGLLMVMNKPVTRSRIWRWNLFGLLDFVVAVALGLALRSNILGGDINTDAMGTLPLVMFPAFAVPLMVIVHVMIFQQLANARPVVT